MAYYFYTPKILVGILSEIYLIHSTGNSLVYLGTL